MLVKTMDQAAPFQCSTSVWGEEKSVLYWPTAQQSEAEVHVTPESTFSCVALVLGEVTMDHASPLGASGMLNAGAAAKLSIASRTPTEPRAKATKMRGLKMPD